MVGKPSERLEAKDRRAIWSAGFGAHMVEGCGIRRNKAAEVSDFTGRQVGWRWWMRSFPRTGTCAYLHARGNAERSLSGQVGGPAGGPAGGGTFGGNVGSTERTLLTPRPHRQEHR